MSILNVTRYRKIAQVTLKPRRMRATEKYVVCHNICSLVRNDIFFRYSFHREKQREIFKAHKFNDTHAVYNSTLLEYDLSYK